MQFSCTQENLNVGLQVTSHLAGKQVNLPILNNVLISCDQTNIKLTTTNLEIAVNCTIRGKVEKPGDFTVPSKLLADYISLLPKDKVNIKQNDTILELSCGTYSTKINGISSQEFPLIPTVEDTHSFTIPVQELRRAISQVQFSVAPNEARPEIGGVLMKFIPVNNDCHLYLAGTDSYRLAERAITVIPNKPLTQPVQIIVPVRTVAEVVRVLGVLKDNADTPEKVDLRIGESQIMFSYGPIDLISRIIEGKYPDYQQLVPQNFATQIITDRAELIRAIKTTSLFSRSGINDISLSFSATGIVVKAVNAQTGEQITSLPAITTGNDLTITVNYRYFLDGVQAMETDQVAILLNDGNAPCIVKPASDNKITEGYLYIVMPIRQ
jgi:DNA polymerase-3 subunit beta